MASPLPHETPLRKGGGGGGTQMQPLQISSSETGRVSSSETAASASGAVTQPHRRHRASSKASDGPERRSGRAAEATAARVLRAHHPSLPQSPSHDARAPDEADPRALVGDLPHAVAPFLTRPPGCSMSSPAIVTQNGGRIIPLLHKSAVNTIIQHNRNVHF